MNNDKKDILIAIAVTLYIMIILMLGFISKDRDIKTYNQSKLNEAYYNSDSIAIFVKISDEQHKKITVSNGIYNSYNEPHDFNQEGICEYCSYEDK